ncbi:unnamed protein product [Rotaria sp. Silwood2]|nr:unnamed protein product [Rotaria sp. Silwood2]CAF4173469.1 unnamed protein product [Rotaria sp. Silwood2]
MMSTESPTQNQQQQSTTYDERVFNERIRQLFNSIDSSSISHSPVSPHGDIGQMTSIVDALFPEQASFPEQREPRHASTNDLTTAFDRFPLWNNNNNNNNNNYNYNNKQNSSASAFCGGTTNSSSAFVNRRQSRLHSSSRSLRNANYYCQQQQQQNHYRPPPLTRPRFTSSTIRLQSAATTTTSNNNNNNGLQRSSSSLSTNNITCGTTDYQPRFASRLSSTRLPMAAPPVGSHDQIAGNSITIDPIVPPSAASTIGVISQPSSASAGLARSTSSTNAQPQQFVTMTQTTTTTFCYVPASSSLAYNNLSGTNRNATVSHQ